MWHLRSRLHLSEAAGRPTSIQDSFGIQLHRGRVRTDAAPAKMTTSLLIPTSSDVCRGADDQMISTPQEEGTHHRAHTSLPGEPCRAHAELRPRQQEEAGRRRKNWHVDHSSGIRKNSPRSVCVWSPAAHLLSPALQDMTRRRFPS